jgi:putative flippase GtrA
MIRNVGQPARTARSTYGLGTYGQYLLVSAGVGAATIACRELLGLTVPEQRGLWYAATVGGAYLFGIVLNYVCQGRFTFRAADKRSARTFLRFAVVAMSSSLLTMGCSTAILSVLLKWTWLDACAPSLAFACGALAVSPLSFHLAGKWVFE